MRNQIETPSNQARQFWIYHGALPVLLAILLYAWTRFSDFDLQVSQWLFSAGGGHFFDSWFLTDVMHEGVRAAGYTLAYALLLALLTSLAWPLLKAARMPLAFLVISVALGSSIVVELKHLTNVYCPYQLTIFGGAHQLYSPFDISTWNASDSGGQCWPGGHSSYGFAMWAFYFIAREYRRALALPVLITVFTYGNILGGVRVIQGAHFLSHQWWTALLCWFITVFFYVLLLRRDLLLDLAHTLLSSRRRTIVDPLPQGETPQPN
jgi:membrane-associated PAP2 superfamily phosphatase